MYTGDVGIVLNTFSVKCSIAWN